MVRAKSLKDTKLHTLFLTFHSIRFLKVEQVIGQIRIRLQWIWDRPEKFVTIPPSTFLPINKNQTRSLAPYFGDNSLESIKKGEFVFLNQQVYCNWPPAWNSMHHQKLWSYNLHYFDWAWALDFKDLKLIITNWIQNYPLKKHQIGWDSYPTSLRITNWVSLLFGLHLDKMNKDPEFLEKIRNSIFIQSQWLSKHVENHLGGNHLLENAAALIIAGSHFEGSIAEKWFSKGQEILRKQIDEQILEDGMHIERSPMYHLRVTYIFLKILEINNPNTNDLIKVRLPKMLQALRCMCHPDGDITLFNDSAFNVYNSPNLLLKYAAQIVNDPEMVNPINIQGNFSLPTSGYYGSSDKSGNYVVCDVGPIAADHLSGHAHADALSFELSFNNNRVIVDSGVLGYDDNEARKYSRSTAAHNTVEIQGKNQCELWGKFRMARRGRSGKALWKPSINGFKLTGSYRGYGITTSSTHKRTFIWESGGRLQIKDHIVSGKSVQIVSRIHLHPTCNITNLTENQLLINYPYGDFHISFDEILDLNVSRSRYFPQFGKIMPNEVLEFKSQGTDISYTINIQPIKVKPINNLTQH